MAKLAVLLATLATLAACSSGDAATRQYQPQDRPYFTGSIPPCTPVEGGAANPCARSDSGGGSAQTGWAGDTPREISLGFANIGAAHMVLRVTFLPGTVRCEIRKTRRAPTWSGLSDLKATGDILGKITCYMDVRVNEYILGSGPPTLTLVISDIKSFGESVSGGEAERRRRAAERDVVEGSDTVFDWVPDGGLGGLELIQFVGPAIDYGIEVLQTFGGLDLEHRRTARWWSSTPTGTTGVRSTMNGTARRSNGAWRTSRP